MKILLNQNKKGLGSKFLGFNLGNRSLVEEMVQAIVSKVE